MGAAAMDVAAMAVEEMRNVERGMQNVKSVLEILNAN